MGIPARAGVSGSDRLTTDFANAVITGTLTAVGPSKPFSVWGPFNITFWGERTTTLATTAGSLSATAGSATGLAAGDAINSPNVPPGTTVGAIVGTGITLAIPPQYWPGRILAGVAQITNMVAGDSTGATTPSSLATLVGATILNSTYFATGTTVVSVGLDGQSLLMSTPALGTAPVEPLPVGFWFAPTGNAIVLSTTDATALFTSATMALNATVNVERSFDGGYTWVIANIGGSGMIAQFTGGGSAALAPVSVAFGDPEAGMLYRLNVTVLSAIASLAFRYRISTTGQASKSLSLQSI